MFSAVANAVRAVGRFVADCGQYIASKITEFFKPLSSPPQQQFPEKSIGFFENINGHPDFTAPQKISLFTASEMQTMRMSDALSRGYGSKEEAPYLPTLYSHGNGAATVDMPLNWLNPSKVDSGIVHDVTKGKARDDRWEMATSVAAKDIAALVDAKNFKLIEVGGVNVENGLGTAKVAEILQRVHIPENAVLVVGHSAGSHAITKAMSLITRDKAEVYWLMLSPRIPLKKSIEMVKKSGVPFDHVMSINNRNDFIHDVKNRWNPLTWHPFREYDKAPWTHVWLNYAVEMNPQDNRVVRATSIPMDHGTMYNNLASDAQFAWYRNGAREDASNSVAGMVNDFLLKRSHENQRE
jgi:hypothetical protein